MAATRANQVGGADYTSGSLREDLANFITLVSPEKTPHLSMISTNKAMNPRHEWQIDTLEDAADNAQSGSYEFDTANNVNDTPDRLSNYTQVFGKTVHVEGSLLRSNPAGAKNWFQYAVNKRKVEIRRDVERRHLLWHDNEGAAGVNAIELAYATGNTRRMATLSSYAGIVSSAGTAVLQRVAGNSAGTNIAGSNNGGAASLLSVADYNYGQSVVTGDGTSAVANVQLTIGMLNNIFEQVSQNGGMINTAQIPTGLKTRVSDLLIGGQAGAAERRASEMASKLNLAVDTVLTEFGFTVDLVANYIMQRFAADASSVVYFYDSSKIKRSILQPFDMDEDLQGRYGKGAVVFCEETMEVADPSSVAFIGNASAS